MTISKEYSIALDSTLSSTPSPSSPLMHPVKRATRTYGRPRDPQPLDDPDSSITISQSTSASRQSLYRTAPPDIDEEIPPSSQAQTSDDTDAILLADVLPKRRYHNWRTELAHIDQDLDDASNGVVPLAVPMGIEDPLNHKDSPMSLSHESPRDTATGSVRGVESPSDSPHSGGSVSHPTSKPKDSPAIGKRGTRRLGVIHDSDSEEKDDSSPTSPAYPNPITTPQLQLPSSPPTSVEMSKGKGRVRDIPPLRFEETQSMPASVNIKRKSTKDKRRSSDQQNKTKIKAPTKKERLETKRERLRIAAGQDIFIQHSEDQKYTMEKLFASIADLIPREPSDPIQQFSSSPAIAGLSSTRLDAPPIRATSQAPLISPPPKPRVSSPALQVLDSDSEADLPEVGDILHEQKKQDEAERARGLAEMKRRALADAAARRERLFEMGACGSDDDDDGLEIIGGDRDMHVVAEEEAGERRAMKAKHLRPSEGRKRQLLLGKVRAAGDSKSKAAQKEIVGRFKMADSQSELSRMMAARVQQSNKETTKQKEEEWIKRGGKISTMQESGGPTKTVNDAVKIYAEKALKVTEEMDGMDVDDQESDGSDEDWTPDMRGSASPSPSRKDPEDRQSEMENDSIGSEKGLTLDDGEIADADEAVSDKTNFRPRAPRNAAARPRAVLDSDEEDDENDNPTWPGRLYKSLLVPNTSAEKTIVISTPLPGIIHRGSLSSFEEPTEDENENDKENNTRLMYDKSEDKENKAVVRHALVGSSTRPPLSGLSTSPSGLRISGDEVAEDKSRTPFKELLKDDDDPFASRPLSTFAARLRGASPSSPSQLVLSPKPLVFNGSSPRFSQFVDADGDGPLILKSSLKPGKGGNRSISPEPLNVLKGSSEAFSQFLSEDQDKSALDRLRNTSNVDGLSLTLDVRLQPALEVSENFMRQADSIFEKEQEYVLEAANRKPKQKSELYVNDHGFLTQTRPDVSSPEIYRLTSPSQKASIFANRQLQEETSTALGSQSTQRRPLRTLSLSDELESPGPLRRLRKRNMSPPPPVVDGSYSLSPSPSPVKRPLNAFEVLARARDKPLKKLEKSDFVETEAQESDDDEMLGFGGYRKQTAAEEEEGEDLDKTLEGLVDDADMDEKTLGQDLVLEKVKEHQAEDDVSLEKRLKAVTEGQLRVKRRNRGIGLDDSDDDYDDDGAKRIRMKFKKRKIEGDGLEALGEHEETRAFYNAYHDSDDDNELAHLQTGNDTVVHDKYEADDDTQEVITTTEIRGRVREVAQQNEVSDSEPLDPNDVSWLDQDEDQKQIRVTEVSLTSKKPYARRRLALDFDGNFEAPKRTLENESYRARMSSWAKTEGTGRSRNGGTGRSAVGASVTGHGKPKVKAGGGSLRVARGSSSGTTGVDPRKVKVPSLLAEVADRSLRFDDR